MRHLRNEIRNLVREYASLATAPDGFVAGRTPIPSSGKVLGVKEMELMVEAVLDGRLTAGRFNTAFEQRIARVFEVPYALTTNSGSSANLLAVSALTSSILGDRALKPGDEVLTVAAGFPTTVNPIVQNRLVPVFVDVAMPTYNIDPTIIEAAIGPRTRAVVLAHTLGNPFALAVVRRLCDRYGLWLVEDCCDALGSTYDGRMVGTFGDVGTLSFYPAHHITTGEGGAVFTRSAELATVLESLRDWGRDCTCPPGCDNRCGMRFAQQFGQLPYGYDHKYVYSHVGYNLKLTEMQAACGLAQLDQLPAFIEARRRNFRAMSERLAGLTQWLILPEPTPGADPSWFGYPITLRANAGSRLDLLRFLDGFRIGTRLLFAGNLSRQPAYRDVEYRIAGDLKVTDRVMQDTFWLGLYPALGLAQIDYVGSKLEAFFGAMDHGYAG